MHEKNGNKKRVAEPPKSFEEHSKDVQQYLLRGLAQQVNELAMPQLGVVKEMFAKVGLTLMTTKEAKGIRKSISI